jgi:hypothetical protein
MDILLEACFPTEKLEVSPNTAFEPYKKRNKTQQPAELLRKNAKRLYAVFKSKDCFPFITNNKVMLLLTTVDSDSEAKLVSKLTRKELYLLVRTFFGEEAFLKNAPWDELWGVFRRKFIKDQSIKNVSSDSLFFTVSNRIYLNPNLW